METKSLTFSPLGDTGVVLHAGDTIDETTHLQIRALMESFDQHPIPGVVDCVPAFTTLTLFYDPIAVGLEHGSPYETICKRIEKRIELAGPSIHTVEKTRTVEIPVCYGGEYGPHLQDVAKYNGLDEDEVIRLHSEVLYQVYMIGFAPGFPYLGGMSERIAAPRRDTPSLTIPAGSVGIAGLQTGVYPIETPGGWQLIGRTPFPLFSPTAEPPTLLQMGDRVRFRPISVEEYEHVLQEVTRR